MQFDVESAGCDFCGSFSHVRLYCVPDLRLRRFTNEYCVVECRECGHRYLDPRPSAQSLYLHYPDSYYAGREPSDPVQSVRYKKQLEMLPGTLGKLLDVGCATGAWLSVAKKSGWECYGTDFVEARGQMPEIDIRIGEFPNIDYQPDFFDVVTAWGVLEHVYAPSAYFSTAWRVLKPGGKFIFLVPNANSLWSRWAYKEDIPRHVHFFTNKSIRNYASKYVFDVNAINITNNIYSRPATGKGMFKRNILRALGCSWEDIIDGKEAGLQKVAGYFGRFLDVLVDHRIEERLRLSGNMIVELTKIKKS